MSPLLDGSMANTHQSRIVKLPQNAVDFFLPLAPKHPDFVPTAFQRHFGRVKHAACFNGPDSAKDENGKKLCPWVQDYMRHSAISMYLAKTQARGRGSNVGRQLTKHHPPALQGIGEGSGRDRVLEAHTGHGQR